MACNILPILSWIWPARKLSANLYDIYHCCVYSEKTPHGGQRNCPKHVEFYSKNKFENLVHLGGFIIRICHDARSPERKKKNYSDLSLSPYAFLLLRLFLSVYCFFHFLFFRLSIAV